MLIIMKKLIFLSTLFMALFTISAQAGDFGHCKWESYFKYPYDGQSFNYGQTVKVRVQPKNGYHDIKFMKLYVDGSYVRTESKYPYEWHNDHKLKNLSQGMHWLKCRIYTKCGYSKEIKIKIYIKGGHGGGGHNDCHFNNPFELPWCAKFKQGYKVCVYKYNGIKYIRVYNCHTHKVYWYDCYGKIYCSGDTKLHPSKCYKVTCYDFCDDFTGGGNHCNYKADWYTKWYQMGHNKYKLYVKVKPYKYQDIAYMDLYINGKHVRRENNYPFEWGKGGDQYLKYLKPGYYELKCVIVTKCKTKEVIYKKVKVGHVS